VKENINLIEIIEQAKAGNADAFSELYRQYAQTILYHVRHMIVDKENYEDVSQEVVINLLGSIHRLKSAKAFRSWLQIIIRNVCIDHNEKFLRSPESMSVADSEEALSVLEVESVDEQPEYNSIEKEAAENMLRIISELSPMYKEMIVLRYYDELSYREIADAFGISVKTVGSNLTRAKKLLRECIKRNHVTNVVQGETYMLNFNGAGSAGRMVSSKGLLGVLTFDANNTISAEAVHRFTETAVMNVHKMANPMLSTVRNTAGKNSAYAVKVAAGVLAAVMVTVCTGGILTYQSYALPVEQPASLVVAKQTDNALLYSGYAIVVIERDKSGEVQSIIVEEQSGTAEDILYRVMDGAGKAVLSGNGDSITEKQGLNGLDEGVYMAVFVLTDKSGAQAEASREFTVK
jgi:RNA polymerase sigma-70 factor (ECF subfamily)